MKPVLEYNDFRLYIRDFYSEQKACTGFTWRDFAKEAGYSSPVFLKLVCDGKANLSKVGVERVASAMGLVGLELQYFRLLVSFNQEDSLQKKKIYFEDLRKLAEENATTLVGEDQYQYYNSWLNPVVRELAPAIGSPSKIANHCVFEVEVSDVKKSLKLLEKTGLLHKNKEGYSQNAKKVTTGSLEITSLAVREMHKQMGELAVKSLDQVPVPERDVSGLTMGISQSAYHKIVKEIEEFRRRIAAIAMESAGEERIYRMNLQLFPLTKAYTKEIENE